MPYLRLKLTTRQTKKATRPPPVDIAKIQTQVSEPLTLVRCMFLLVMSHACLIYPHPTGVFVQLHARTSNSGKALECDIDMTIALMSWNGLRIRPLRLADLSLSSSSV